MAGPGESCQFQQRDGQRNEIGRAMNRKVRAGQCISIRLCLLLLANARQYVGMMRGLVETVVDTLV